jgi:hypothetical protein
LAAHYSPSGPLTYTALCEHLKMDLAKGPPPPPPGQTRRPRRSGSVDRGGYVRVRLAPYRRGFRLHRMVMEAVLGRFLVPDEDVHHRDGNRVNNHPANLELVAHGEHTARHKRRLPLVAGCAWCGQPFLVQSVSRWGQPGVRVPQRCCCCRCARLLRSAALKRARGQRPPKPPRTAGRCFRTLLLKLLWPAGPGVSGKES